MFFFNRWRNVVDVISKTDKCHHMSVHVSLEFLDSMAKDSNAEKCQEDRNQSVLAIGKLWIKKGVYAIS